MTIDRTSLRWNGWGPAAQPDALPKESPAWQWIADALGILRLRYDLGQIQRSVRLREPRVQLAKRQ